MKTKVPVVETTFKSTESDEMRYWRPVILILLQGLLSARCVNEFGVFTLEYELLSNLLKLIGYKSDKYRALTFQADWLAYIVYSVRKCKCKRPIVAADCFFSATLWIIELKFVVNAVQSK